MGNFYTNITLQGPTQDEVAEALAAMGRSAYVSPTVDGFTVVFHAECEMQDDRVLRRLTADLTTYLACPGLAVLDHDDDILWYALYTNGELIDEYNSCPDYFELQQPPALNGGDPAKLIEAFGVTADADETRRVLRASNEGDDGFVFAFERHEALARLLGLPLFAVACGFRCINQGELPEGLTRANLRRVGSASYDWLPKWLRGWFGQVRHVRASRAMKTVTIHVDQGLNEQQTRRVLDPTQ
jgi:hypothetical protein